MNLTKSKFEVKVPTECYSRIVGYYRPVQNWNMGKKQEFSERAIYNIDRFKVPATAKQTNKVA